MSDPVRAIARTLGQRCVPFATAEIRHRHSAPWRSLLFDGARHRIGLALSGEGSDAAVSAACDAISASDLAIAGHLLVELSIADVECHDEEVLVTLDALTIEAARDS
jgi:hypothetical protein